MTLLASWTMDMWAPIINLFNFIPNYAWMIVVFTIALKIVLSPLDMWQKKVSRDSMVKQQKLQPEIAKINQKFKNNQQMVNQKTMELYKRENYNVVGSCLSMFLNLAITLFVFITLFTALIEISQNKTYDQYMILQNTYDSNFNSEFRAEYGLTATENNADITDKINQLVLAQETQAKTNIIANDNTKTMENITADEWKAEALRIINSSTPITTIINNSQIAVANKYDGIKDDWLWVQNIWRPDTAVSGYPSFSDFKNMSNLTGRLATDSNEYKYIESNFNTITKNVQTNYSGWNGYFILVILAALITYLSVVISQKTTAKSKSQQNQMANPQTPQLANPAGAGKIMKFVMPIIMVIFTISYSAAFALYIVINSAMGTIINFLSLKIFDKMDSNKKNKLKEQVKVSYSR